MLRESAIPAILAPPPAIAILMAPGSPSSPIFAIGTSALGSPIPPASPTPPATALIMASVLAPLAPLVIPGEGAVLMAPGEMPSVVFALQIPKLFQKEIAEERKKEKERKRERGREKD